MPFEECAKINYDYPDSLGHELLYEHLLQLQKGHAFQIPCYDYNKHLRLKETKTISRHHIILLEEILLFIEPKLGEMMDSQIFMDTLLDICLLRRLQQDIVERDRL